MFFIALISAQFLIFLALIWLSKFKKPFIKVIGNEQRKTIIQSVTIKINKFFAYFQFNRKYKYK